VTAPDIDAAPVNFALYFAEYGLRVLPIPARSKRPIIKDWPNAATTDPDVICGWFEQDAGGNYGIATAGLVAVDIDPRHGGHLWLEDNEHRLPETYRFRTGGGGLHLVYKAPEGQSIGNRANIAPGIDIRGNGGQIIGPGSIHPRGGRYTIEIGPDDVDLAEVSPWLVELILPPPAVPRSRPKPLSGDIDCYCAAAIADELRRLGQAGEGRRNDQLNRSAFAIAGFVLAGVVPEDWARATLEQHADAVDLPLPEARRTIESAFKAAKPRELTR
jgi:hypothetical protein